MSFKMPYQSVARADISSVDRSASVLFTRLELRLQGGTSPFGFANHGFTLEFETEAEVKALKFDVRWSCHQTDGSTTTALISLAGDVNSLTVDGEHAGNGMETYEVEFEEPVNDGEFNILIALATERMDEEDETIFTIDSIDVSLL